MIDGNWLYTGESLRPGKKPTLDFRTAYWAKGPKTRGDFAAAPERSSRLPDVTSEGDPAGYVLHVGDDPVSQRIAESRPFGNLGEGQPLPSARDAVRMMEGADQDRALAVEVKRLLDEAETTGSTPYVFIEKIDPVTGEVRTEAISAKAVLLRAEREVSTARDLKNCVFGDGND